MEEAAVNGQCRWNNLKRHLLFARGIADAYSVTTTEFLSFGLIIFRLFELLACCTTWTLDLDDGLCCDFLGQIVPSSSQTNHR